MLKGIDESYFLFIIEYSMISAILHLPTNLIKLFRVEWLE